MNNRRAATFLIGAATTCAGIVSSPNISRAQQPPAATVERFERTLEQIRRDTRLEASPDIPIDQRTYYDAGAFFTFNYFSLDDANLENTGFRQYDLTAYGRVVIDGANEFFVRGRASYRDYNDGDNLNEDESSGLDGMLERAFWRFDLARARAAYGGQQSKYDFTLKAGRDFVVWANGLVLANVIDGATIDIGVQPFTLTLLGGITAKETVDFDSARPYFDRDTHRGFYGAQLTSRVGAHRPFVYAIWQRDYNHHDDSFTPLDDTGTNGIDTAYHYDSYYIGIGANGSLTDRLTYGIEFAYEGGDTLSNSFSFDTNGNVVPGSQTTDDIEAYALDFQLDYLVGDPRQTRFTFETILASGDDDRLVTSSTLGGNAPGTKDRAFNAFGLLNTGLAFGPSVSNLLSLRIGAATFPFPDIRATRRLQIGTDFFVFHKLDSDAPIDEATDDRKFLGVEPDIYLNWQITSDLALSVRYGAFFPSDTIENDGKIRQFLYTGVTIAF